jgi:hypothetical protein
VTAIALVSANESIKRIIAAPLLVRSLLGTTQRQCVGSNFVCTHSSERQSEGDGDDGDGDHQQAVKNDQAFGAIAIQGTVLIPTRRAEDSKNRWFARYFEFFDWEFFADVASRTFPHGSVFGIGPDPELLICL